MVRTVGRTVSPSVPRRIFATLPVFFQPADGDVAVVVGARMSAVRHKSRLQRGFLSLGEPERGHLTRCVRRTGHFFCWAGHFFWGGCLLGYGLTGLRVDGIGGGWMLDGAYTRYAPTVHHRNLTTCPNPPMFPLINLWLLLRNLFPRNTPSIRRCRKNFVLYLPFFSIFVCWFENCLYICSGIAEEYLWRFKTLDSDAMLFL